MVSCESINSQNQSKGADFLQLGYTTIMQGCGIFWAFTMPFVLIFFCFLNTDNDRHMEVLYYD